MQQTNIINVHYGPNCICLTIKGADITIDELHDKMISERYEQYTIMSTVHNLYHYIFIDYAVD